MLPLNEILIRKARVLALASDYGDEYGVDQELFVESLRKASRYFQSICSTQLREPFVAFKEIDVDTTAQYYDLPTDVLANNFIYTIQFSPDGSAQNYDDLSRVFERDLLEYGNPEEYYLAGNKFYPQPTPNTSGGKLRIRYEQAIEDLDIRRGTIDSVADDGTYITLVLESSASGRIVAPDDDGITNIVGDFISVINDSSGTGTMIDSAIYVMDYDTSSKTITTSIPIATGTSCAAGHYIAFGRNANIRSSLPPLAESYFIEFLKVDIFEPLSDTDVVLANPKLASLISQIIEIYSTTATGKLHVPERRRDYGP